MHNCFLNLLWVEMFLLRLRFKKKIEKTELLLSYLYAPEWGPSLNPAYGIGTLPLSVIPETSLALKSQAIRSNVHWVSGSPCPAYTITLHRSDLGRVKVRDWYSPLHCSARGASSGLDFVASYILSVATSDSATHP